MTSVIFALAFVSFADRLHLSDGTILEVDEAWEDAQGVWFRRGNVRQLLDRSRIRSIERSKPAVETDTKAGKSIVKATEKEAASPSAPTLQSTWIHLTGGARVEVDEATEKADGVWYRRGALSIFLERARVERIERGGGAPTASAATISAGRAWHERGWSTGNNRIDDLIHNNGALYGVDPFLIFCVMEQESRFHPRAVSSKGARGLMQLMPGTARRYGVRRVHDPAENIRGGTRYLKELLGTFGGRVDLALASYNAGEGAVVRYGRKVPPYRETRYYVKRISARYGRSRGTGAEAAGKVAPPPQRPR
jgi:soluble lytic murein transglycosylase-like protein